MWAVGVVIVLQGFAWATMAASCGYATGCLYALSFMDRSNEDWVAQLRAGGVEGDGALAELRAFLLLGLRKAVLRAVSMGDLPAAPRMVA